MRGHKDLLRVPKWTDSACQTVDFPPYRFYPDRQVHVQVTVNHMKLNDSVTVHDAVTSWTENVNTKNFTVCVMQAGRSGESLNPFASVDWLAYQGAPPEGITGTVKMQKWWSGTKCADVTFPKVGFEHEAQSGLYLSLFTRRFMSVIIQRAIVQKRTSGDEYASFIRSLILCVHTKLKRQVCIRSKSPNSYVFERRASLMRRPYFL